MTKKQKGIGPHLECDRSLADSTVINYKNGWRHWNAHCEKIGIVDFPAKPKDVAEFLIEMAKTYKTGTVRLFASAISVVHKERGKKSPLDSLDVGRAKRKITKEGKATRQAHPINREVRDMMIAVCNRGTLEDLRDRALISLAYDSLGRRGELVGINDDEFERAKEVPGGTIFFRFSKTDQTGVGRTAYVTPATCDHIDAWRAAAKIEAGRLFRSTNHNTVGKSLGPKAINSAFKKRARQAGVRAEIVMKIGGHSSRVGAAQDLSAAGADDTAIMLAGGWRNKDAMLKYIEKVNALRAGAARLAAEQKRAGTNGPKPSISITCQGNVAPELMSVILEALAPIATVTGFNFASSDA